MTPNSHPELADFDTTAGTVEEVAETLRRIEAMGVSTLYFPWRDTPIQLPRYRA